MCLQCKSVENTVGKGEIACNKQFLLLHQFSLPVWTTFCHFHQNLKLPFANSFSLEESKIFCLGKGYVDINPLPNKSLFLRVCSTSLLKTLWEKEKLLITSNFSFSQSVFYSSGELFTIFLYQNLNCLQTVSLGELKICHFGKG